MIRSSVMLSAKYFWSAPSSRFV
jgi:hypothetical protein